MNTPKAFELALSAIFRQFGDIGSGVMLFCWQSPRADRPEGEDAEETAEFPQVNIRCAPPVTEEQGSATFACDASILIGTKVDEDLDHAVISKLYEGVQGVLDDLYAQARAGTGEVYEAFMAEVAKEIATGLHVGGLTFTSSVSPYDDDGTNIIGLAIQVHYSREDI